MKTCEHCGAELVRHPKHSNRQWAAKRFCGRACASAAIRKDIRCACGCDERPVTGRKYVKGHRPIMQTADGYRRVWVGKSHPLANSDGNCLEHRLVLFNAGIPIPPGYHVHHRNHDRLDNHIENLEVIKPADHGRHHSPNTGKTHCVNGHAFDEANTFIDKSGWRRCRACNRERQRARTVRAAVSA